MARILIRLLGTEATGLERARSKEVQEGGGRVGGVRVLLDHVVEVG